MLSRQLRESAIASERQRVSRELHDGVLQSLAGVALSIRAARDAIGKDPHGAASLLRSIEQMLQGEQRELRTYLEELSRSADAEASRRAEPLSVRVRQLCKFLGVIWNIAIDVAVAPEVEDTDAVDAHELTRLIQEAVANAARHGPATTVRVSLERVPYGIRLCVTDDGKGFSTHGRFEHDALLSAQFGPAKLRDRVRDVDGSLTIDSTPHGASITMTLPDAVTT